MARRYSLLVLAIVVSTVINQSVANDDPVNYCDQASEGYCIPNYDSCGEGFEPVSGAFCLNPRKSKCCRLPPPPPPTIRCPEGYFLMQKSMQCFQLFVGDGKVSWSKAMADCKLQDAVIAQPSDDVALDLREYLYTQHPETFPPTVNGWYAGVWMGARRVYEFQWLDDRSLPENDPLWMQLESKYPGPSDIPVTSCAMMLVSDNLAKVVSKTSVYGTDKCVEEKYYTLCEKAPIE